MPEKIRLELPKYHYDPHANVYILDEDYTYYSPRYDKVVKLYAGMLSDGATWAIDIETAGWWVHDELCKSGKFRDLTPCSRWQGSMILSDILKAEGQNVRTLVWRYATYIPWKIKSIFKSIFN